MKDKMFGSLVAAAVSSWIASGAVAADKKPVPDKKSATDKDSVDGKCLGKDSSCAGRIKVKHEGKEIANSCAGQAVVGVTKGECTAAGGTWEPSNG